MKPSIVIHSDGVPIHYPDANEVLYVRAGDRSAVGLASMAMARAELCKPKTDYWRPVIGVGVSQRQIVVRTPSTIHNYDFRGGIPPLEFLNERVRLLLSDPSDLPLGGIGKLCPAPIDVLVSEYQPNPVFGPTEWEARLIEYPCTARELRHMLLGTWLLPIDNVITAGHVMLRDKIQSVVKSTVAFWIKSYVPRVVSEAWGQGPLIIGPSRGMPLVSRETMSLHWPVGAKTEIETLLHEDCTRALMSARQDGDTYSGPLFMHPGLQAAMVAAGYDFPPNADVRDVVRSARSLN